MADKFIQSLLDGDLETANSIVLAGTSVDSTCGENSWTPLLFMAENGALDSARWLLAHGANPNKADVHGWTPLSMLKATAPGRNMSRLAFYPCPEKWYDFFWLTGPMPTR